MKPLSSIKENKKVLVRIDINSPLSNKKVQDNPKFKESIETIKFLLKKNCSIVLIAHQGKKGSKDFISLEQHKKILQKHLRKRILFSKYNKSLDNKIKELKPKQILLLENVRFLNPTSKILKYSKYFDAFVFEAFPVSHHPLPSVTGLRKKLPTYSGLSYDKELKHLEKIKRPKHPYIIILGGNKPEDLIHLLKLRKVDYFLVSGVLAELFLITHRHNLGKKQQLLKENGHLKLLPLIKKLKNSKKIILPIDLAIDVRGQRQIISFKDLPSRYIIRDIGPETIKLFKPYIKKAKTIYYKGPQGFYDIKNFDKGTKSILKLVAKSKAFTIAGGGHSYNAITKFIKPSKISYLSTAGGALLHYILKK